MTRRVSILLGLVLPLALAVPASATYESDFVSRTNSARASHGLRSYPSRYDLTAVARRQAQRMAAAHRIYHNPNLGSEVGNWRAIAENVGRGSSVSAIQSAFMASPAHRENILSTLYTEFGVGTARGSDGMIYVSEVFRRPYGATSYTPPRRTYRAPSRISRSAPRRAPAVVRPAKKRVVVDPTRLRLNRAWFVYRSERKLGSIDRAVAYLHASRKLV